MAVRFLLFSVFAALSVGCRSETSGSYTATLPPGEWGPSERQDQLDCTLSPIDAVFDGATAVAHRFSLHFSTLSRSSGFSAEATVGQGPDEIFIKAQWQKDGQTVVTVSSKLPPHQHAAVIAELRRLYADAATRPSVEAEQ